jgi:cupin superfamily protein
VWDTRHRSGDDRDAKGAVDAAAAAPPAISAEIRPGDVIYMPRRTPHAARTQQALSGHLTIGIPAITWRQLVEGVVQRALDTAGLDEPLPAAYHRDPDATARELEARIAEVQRGLDKTDPGEAAGRSIERFLTTRPAVLRGGLVDVTRLADLDDRTVVRRREGSACEVLLRDGALTVLLGDRALRMPARCEPAMRAVAQADAFTPADLEAYLDPDGRLVLVRRLVREGLLEVVGAD